MGLVGAASLLIRAATGCSTSEGLSSQSGPAACAAAGGQCVIPNLHCKKVGPQDCNPAPANAGGAYCCLDETDADLEQGPADAAAMTPDAQSVSIETSACAAAGGQCKAAASCTALSPETCENGAVCCFDDICASEDASPQVIMASSYDQSCTVDTDCVGVSEGNSCKPCDFSCSNATINAGALAKYTSDTAHFPAVVAFDHGVCPSSCGGPVGLCCLGGKCHRGSPCPFEVLMGGDAGADAGDAAATDGSVVDANVE
jgi:hypothetical protein